MVESVAFLKSKFFKNVSAQGGAQAHAIKTCPKDHLVVSRQNDKHPKLWGFMTPANYLDALDKNHNLFEIITSYPHKVYFDIDRAESDNFPEFLETIKKQILSFFPEALIALSGSNNGKASVHAVLQNYMIFNETQRNYVRQIASDCGFDTAVYTKNRLMKCVNQSKSDGRVQSVIEDEDLKHHSITYFITENRPFPVLPEAIVEKVSIEQANYFDLGTLPKIHYKTTMDLHDLDVKQILTLLPCTPAYHHAYTHLVARFCFSQGISFETFMAWRLQKGDVDWRHNWSRLHLYPEVTIDRIKALLCILYPKFRKDKYYAQFCNSFDVPSEKIETISQETFQCETKAMILNTGMGSGKTAQTIDYLADKEFIWITPNIALTNNTEQRFGGTVVNYKNVSAKDKNTGKLNEATRLLMSLHSLHYVSKSFPIVVIDEVESVLNIFHDDFLQGKKGLKHSIWTAFMKLLVDAEKVILLDAFTTTKTTQLLDQLSIPYTIYERMIEPTTRTVKFCENRETMIADICAKLKKNLKILVFYPFKKEHPILKEMFEETGKTVKIYNADVDDAAKKELANVNDAWDASCVIINNVITCGVNYEKKDFDYMYIFSATFNSPRDLIQVSYRARHLTSGFINVTFLPGLKATTYPDDCKVMNCPIYMKLYHSILTEKYAPLKNAFKKFCIQAHYSQTMDKHSIEKALQDEIKQKLEDNQFYYKYGDIEEIDLCVADSIKDKCFEQCATMYEKVQLQKYYYNLQFVDKSHDDVARAWDDKLFFFLKQTGYMMTHDDCLFRKIADFNGFDLFPSDITKVKLNPELIDQIFEEFRFKNLSKSSSSKKILKEIYNVFFKHNVVQSEYNAKTKNVTYSISSSIEEYRNLYTTNFCMHEIGTWIPLPLCKDIECDQEPDMI
jgi:hypothetical protein